MRISNPMPMPVFRGAVQTLGRAAGVRTPGSARPGDRVHFGHSAAEPRKVPDEVLTAAQQMTHPRLPQPSTFSTAWLPIQMIGLTGELITPERTTLVIYGRTEDGRIAGEYHVSQQPDGSWRCEVLREISAGRFERFVQLLQQLEAPSQATLIEGHRGAPKQFGLFIVKVETPGQPDAYHVLDVDRRQDADYPFEAGQVLTSAEVQDRLKRLA